MAPSPLINDDKRHTEECTPRKENIKMISHHDRIRKVSVPNLPGEGLRTEPLLHRQPLPPKKLNCVWEFPFAFGGILSCSPTHLFIFHACKSLFFDYEIANDVTFWFLVVQKCIIFSWWHGVCSVFALRRPHYAKLNSPSTLYVCIFAPV